MRAGKQLDLRIKERSELLQRKGSVIVDRDKAQMRAHPFRDQLPGHQIAVVLHLGQENDVVCAKKFSAFSSLYFPPNQLYGTTWTTPGTERIRSR